MCILKQHQNVNWVDDTASEYDSSGDHELTDEIGIYDDSTTTNDGMTSSPNVQIKSLRKVLMKFNI